MKPLVVSALLLLFSTASPIAQPVSPAPAVLVAPATLKPLARQAEFIGRVQAMDKVDLRARVQGFLGPRQFTDGSAVQAGQTLFTIEAAPFEAALAGARASLAAAQATLTNAEQQLARAKELREGNTVSQATLDQRAAEATRARADVLQAEATVRDAEIKLSYTTIKTPLAGRVGRSLVSPGNLVGPDTGVLATVVAEDKVQVLFPITARELLLARQGKPGEALLVRARLGDDSWLKQPGTVDFLDVQADPRTDTVQVRAVFDNAERMLTDGQSVRIAIEQATPEAALTIPQPAVATDQTGPYVFVVGDGNVVARRAVKLGRQREGLVEVVDGVKVGERVVVQGLQRARPGQVVNPQPLPQPAP